MHAARKLEPTEKPKTQKFSLRTPYMKQGRITQLVAETENMVVPADCVNSTFTPCRAKSFCSTAMEPASCVAVAPEKPKRSDSAAHKIWLFAASATPARTKKNGDLAKQDKISFVSTKQTSVTGRQRELTAKPHSYFFQRPSASCAGLLP